MKSKTNIRTATARICSLVSSYAGRKQPGQTFAEMRTTTMLINTMKEAAAELRHWQSHASESNFTSQVFNLLQKADPQNRVALELAFPMEAQAFREFMAAPTAEEFYRRHESEEAESPKCGACGDAGFILASGWRQAGNARGQGEFVEIERCDACEKFADDDAATTACYHLAQHAIILAATCSGKAA